MSSLPKNRPEQVLDQATSEAIDPSGFDGPALRVDYLEYRLRRELSAGATNRPLSAAELAEILAHYRRRPLPDDLHGILCAILRGERRSRKRGPKPKTDSLTLLQRHLLPIVYEQGIERGRALVPWLKSRGQRLPRNALRKEVPTVQMLAALHVKANLPAFRHMSPKAIANLVSRMR